MTDPHAPLRDDVRLLGELLGDTLRAREGEPFFALVEHVRALAKSARAGDENCFEELTKLLGTLSIDSAVPVARAFAHFLALANIAEQHHRIRRRREHAREATSRPQQGSCDEAFTRLRASGIAPDVLADTVSSLRIELVLTAHPTEILRRTLLQAYNRIARLLDTRDRRDLTPADRDAADDALRRSVAILWQTEDVRDTRVTPLDEVRAGLAIFEETLWDAIPAYARAVDRALRRTTGRHLPIDATPITFGSWIGGDRDGNPNVTPSTTHDAVWLARWEAADLYLRDIDALRAELSLTTASAALREYAGDAPEPYRAVLRTVRDRLLATRADAETRVAGPDRPALNGHQAQSEAPFAPYGSAAELRDALERCYRSLVDTGNELVADGRLTDILRRVATFGLSLARLDIRQESQRHADAVAWIFGDRGLGDYGAADEAQRRARLVARLTAPDPIVLDDRAIARAPDSVRDVLDTFRMAAMLPAESLGAYVITMAHEASDVLAVEFLQRAAGNPHPQRVVPLFETAADLQHAAETLRTLFAEPWYRDRVGGRQEVMVGYSDSAKDAGRFAAAWALYRAQDEIARTCRDAGVAVTLFHGRGGSVGRGGGPTWLAIQSQPPGSVDGSLRVTEQGEMIQAKFGLPEIALRTLEVYTTATLEATLRPPATPAAEWGSRMDRLFEDARQGYRSIVFEHPRFVEYFRSATPEPEIRTINIGSRPARRPSAGGGVESLRAIPWQFAWTQTRLLLASWLGVETAIGRSIDRGELDELRRMYDAWPFFRSTIGLMEMVIAKADEHIAALYDRGLVADDLRPLGRELRERLGRAGECLRQVTGQRDLLETNPVLRRSIEVRNPYVDPINLVQIDLLKRLRASGEHPPEALHRAFVVTVNGIAAGMRNTG